MKIKKAIVLLSGGLDSATTLYYAINKGYKCYCLLFNYGQKHIKEVRSAVKLANITKCEYKIIKIILPWKGSSLLDNNNKIPHHDRISTHIIPSTYVPARNTIFLSFALSWADAIKIKEIFIGANAVDFSGYPDCRPGYFRSFQKTASLGTKKGLSCGIKLNTPLIKMTKSEIVKLADRLKVPFHLTWSCYEGGKKTCGKCDSCVLRRKGFKEADIQDPLEPHAVPA